MVIEITLPFFNDPNIYFKCFSPLAIGFKSLDWDRGVDKSIEKSWPLRWQPKLGPNFLMVQIIF